jgi:hypothetical protein
LGALLVAIPLTVGACSSSGGGTATTPPAQPPTTTSAPASTPPASTSSAASGAGVITADKAQAALLTTQDVGAGFTKAQFQASNDPLPCAPNDPPLEQQFPSNSEYGTAFIRNGAAFGEDLRIYPDAHTANEVVARAAVGLNCPSGKLNLTGKPTTVHFVAANGGRVQNVTSNVGADFAIAVQGTTAQYSLVLIGCQVENAAVLFSFLRTKSTPTSSLPNPLGIVQTAIQKLRNA